MASLCNIKGENLSFVKVIDLKTTHAKLAENQSK